MRPVSKVQVQESQPVPQQSEDKSDDEPIQDDELVTETQLVTKPNTHEDEALDYNSESDASSKEDPIPDRCNDEHQPTSNHAKVAKSSKKAKEVPFKITKPTKKKVVKPEAHANYVKLKIKNQNSKGNKGKGRFGQRNR